MFTSSAEQSVLYSDGCTAKYPACTAFESDVAIRLHNVNPIPVGLVWHSAHLKMSFDRQHHKLLGVFFPPASHCILGIKVEMCALTTH